MPLRMEMEENSEAWGDALNRVSLLISNICLVLGEDHMGQIMSDFFLPSWLRNFSHIWGVWLLGSKGNFYRKVVTFFTLEVALIYKIAWQQHQHRDLEMFFSSGFLDPPPLIVWPLPSICYSSIFSMVFSTFVSLLLVSISLGLGLASLLWWLFLTITVTNCLPNIHSLLLPHYRTPIWLGLAICPAKRMTLLCHLCLWGSQWLSSRWRKLLNGAFRKAPQRGGWLS